MDRPSFAKSGVWQRIRNRPVETYNKTWLGAIAVGVIGALIGTMLLFKAIGFGYSTYTAEFAQAGGLQTGNPVSLAGVNIGTVTSTELAGDRVLVRVSIRDDIKLRKDTKAAIKIGTILGSHYVEIRNAGDGRLANRTIGLANTEVPYDLQAVLNDSATTFGDVDAKAIADSVGVLAKQMEGLPPIVPTAMENLQTLSSVIARRRDQLGTLLKSTDTVTTTLHRQQADIGNLVNQGQDLLGEFVSRRQSFHAMMQAVKELTDVLGRIVVRDRGAVDKFIKDVRAFTDMLGQHDDLFRSLLQVIAPAARGGVNSMGTGNSIEFNVANGIAIDSWMCAISGRAKQFGMIPYFKDCQ